MKEIEKKIKLFAQVIYESRQLLKRHLGSNDPDHVHEKFAAHLAWMFHNEALAVLEDKDFDYERSLRKLKKLDLMFNDNLSERFGNSLSAK
jgi:hypothetical protein